MLQISNGARSHDDRILQIVLRGHLHHHHRNHGVPPDDGVLRDASPRDAQLECILCVDMEPFSQHGKL